MTTNADFWKKESKRVFEIQKHASDRADLKTRVDRLRRLSVTVRNNFAEVQSSIEKDLGRSPTETKILELLPTLEEIHFAAKNVARWIAPKSVPTPIALLGTESEIRHVPKGTVLIISPWNYPVFCSLAPLVGALAAGNRVILKPSELAPATSHTLKKMISQAFKPEEVSVFEGDHEVSEHLLKMPFDHVLFTGSTRVGKLVMAAAAENLIPVTLELGGKSPAVVDESADLEDAARKICWGKFCNSGQTCVAPDYVLVPTQHKERFLKALKSSIQELYGSNPKTNTDMARIVNKSNFDRLQKITKDSLLQGAQAYSGGQFDEARLSISPTILTEVTGSMPIMQSEIFGPILPVLDYKNLSDATDFIRAGSKPLALYIFSKNSTHTEEILARTTSGGVCVNDTLIQLGNCHLPFGGIGESGMGNYHGEFGFKAFSHERSVLKQGRWNLSRYLYPPYTKRTESILSFLFNRNRF